MDLRLDTARGAFAAGILAGPALIVCLTVARVLADRAPREAGGPLGPPALSAQPALALAIPVDGVTRAHLRDSFDDDRAGRPHAAIDILAPRSTPVSAVADGTIARLSRSVRGGIAVYQRDAARAYCFYYAHLEGYAPGLREGLAVRRGETIGTVGTSGNAQETTPHLHFAVLQLDSPEQECARGSAVNPFPLLQGAASPRPGERRGTSVASPVAAR